VTPEERVEKHLEIVARETEATALPLLTTPEALFRAVERTYLYEEGTKKALVDALARDPKCLPVCAPGCAYCCHLSVFASTPEILYLAERLRPAGPELAERIARAAEAIRDLGQEERARAKRPCPLLERETGRCGVYAARPLACRAYNSCDAGVCARAFDDALVHWNMPVDLFQLTVSRNVRKGLIAAARAGGLDPGPYELACGLAVALRIPDAAARWLAREPIFAEAETRIGRERRASW
jgi:Fe-S-cluster containining protein